LRILFTADRAAKVIYFLTVDTRGRVYKHSLKQSMRELELDEEI
jgi:hypothetical protein